MKLLRHGEPGAENPGIVDTDGRVRDLTEKIPDIDPVFLESGMIEAVRALDLHELPIVPPFTRLGPCVGNIGKIVAVGLNYADHAAEAGLKAPKEPILFLKATSSISGPNDDVRMPRSATKLDWEVELGVVIGRSCCELGTDDDPLEYIAGYCVFNDISERSFQLEREGQWTKGKSFDTFGPVGPWLVTTDEITDPQNLRLWLEVDGTPVQDSNTSKMIFSVAHLVRYVSQFMTLLPGDLIVTGTPAGVGLGMNPPRFLAPGVTVKLGIDGLGTQTQIIRG